MKIFLKLFLIFLLIFFNQWLVNADEKLPFDTFWKSAEGRLQIFEENSEENKINKIPNLKSFSNEEEENINKIKGINLQIFCFGNGKNFQLGSCSSTFLKCGDFNNLKQRFNFEECPLGEVFIGNKCKPARRVKDCFLPQVNLLNDATEKLAQAVNCCARHKPFTPTIYFLDGHSSEEQCSRQALICRGTAAKPLAISCPPGKIILMKNMTCAKSPQHCNQAISENITPIRTHLLRLLCDGPPLFPQSLMKANEERCRNWYAVCEGFKEPEFVFCDGGKIFDKERGLCRRILTEDQCPHLSACRGWEWRMSAIGDCRSEFLFCNGMRPQLFQCDRAGDVFKDGECVAANVANCNVCQPGEMKRSTDKCEQFFFCESNDNSPTNWRQYICTDGNVFHPQRQECVSPSEFQCPIKTQCQEGDYYSVECGDFFLCVQGKYIIAKCPDWTQWNGKEKRCVYSDECRRFKEQKSSTDLSKLTCSEGEIRPSSDCKTFEECRSGSWIKKSCHEYASDRLKDPCRFCKQTQTSIITKEKYEDYYPVENVLPEGFNPFNEKIGIKQRRCIEGEKIINKHDCTHFMECIDGDWFNLACPTNYYFNTKTLGCVLATSSLNSSFIPICQEFENKINLKLNNNNLQLNNDKIESLHLLPIYSANDSFYVKRATPGLGPLPELNDKVLKANYKYSFVFCTAKSPLRIPNYYDCTKYSECALELGGYYTEKQCALGTQFDPSLLMCTYNYTCLPTNCTSGQRQSLPECGKAKECRDGKWHEFTCPNSMAFVDGKCSEVTNCHKNLITNIGQCVEGHARVHPRDCSKYLLCRYGQYVEESCHLGHRFNPKISQCDPKYICLSTHLPPCFEGELRQIISTNKLKECQSEYENCWDGKFHKQICPFGERFNLGKCEAFDKCG
ncbi:hypothetical protein ACQ4LE_007955, partial [Meloidogyne hapla]